MGKYHPRLALGEEPDPELLQFELGSLPALGALLTKVIPTMDFCCDWLWMLVTGSRVVSRISCFWVTMAPYGVTKQEASGKGFGKTNYWAPHSVCNFQKYSLLLINPARRIQAMYHQRPAVPCSWFHHLPDVAKPQKDWTSPLQNGKLRLNQIPNLLKKKLTLSTLASETTHGIHTACCKGSGEQAPRTTALVPEVLACSWAVAQQPLSCHCQPHRLIWLTSSCFFQHITLNAKRLKLLQLRCWQSQIPVPWKHVLTLPWSAVAGSVP